MLGSVGAVGAVGAVPAVPAVPAVGAVAAVSARSLANFSEVAAVSALLAVSELVLVVCSVAVCVFYTCTAVVLAASFTSSALTLTLLPKAKNIPNAAAKGKEHP